MKFYDLLCVLDPNTELRVRVNGFEPRVATANAYIHVSYITPVNYLRVKYISIITKSEQEAHFDGTPTTILNVELES